MNPARGQKLPPEPLRCACCGADIEDFPTDFAAAAPWRGCGVTDVEFDERVHLTSDICVVDDREFFIRGNIELPIVGTGKSFAWGVWCSLSKESFERVLDRWDAPDRERDEARFGWLCTVLPGYPRTTWLLKTMVRQRPGNLAPLVDVESGSHPIADEQRQGIRVERWHELVRAAMGKDVGGGS